MSIYIARGNDTLGPYPSAEAAALVKSGYLSPRDLAARSGDPAWVALSTLLPAETAVPVEAAPAVAAVGDAPLSGWHRRALLISVLLVPVVLAGGLLLMASRLTRPTRSRPPESLRAAAALPLDLPTPARPPAGPGIPAARPAVPVARATPAPTAPPTPPPMPVEKGGPLNGTISLAAADGPPVSLDAVQVRAFPLGALMPYLMKKKEEVQAELARLAPQLEASETERNARVAVERGTLQAFLAADPSDDMYSTLRFTHEQAQAAVKNAEDDCRYFLDLRREASTGEPYFQDLPEPVATAGTNAAGEFSLELPPGEPMAVAACVRQVTDSGPRLRYWLVRVFAGGGERKPVTLSDANATSVPCAESLVLTPE